MIRAMLIMGLASALVACGSSDSDGGSATEPDWPSTRVVIDDAVIDRGDVFEIIDPVWWSVNIYDSVGAYENSLESFSYPQRLVFAIAWYRSEVNNGGHDQFFYNSTGIVWQDALEGFEKTRLDKFAEVLNDAVGRFSEPPSLDREVRNEQMDEDEPAFDDLDSRYYELEESVNMDARLMRYIKNNRETFYFDGDVKKPGK